MTIKKLSDIPVKNQFSLLTTAEHPSMTYVDKAYIRADGEVFLHAGKPHVYKRPLDRTNAEDAKLILAGKKDQVMKCDGTYIGANPKGADPNKKIVLVVSFTDVIADKERIYTAYIPVLKAEKRKKNLQGQTTPDIDAQIDSLEEELKNIEPEEDETADQRIADLKSIGVVADADGNFKKGSIVCGQEILTCGEKKFKTALNAFKNA